MLRHYTEGFKTFLWSRMYEYRCAAEWGVEQSYIIKMRVNKWTRAITIIEKTVIINAGISYRLV